MVFSQYQPEILKEFQVPTAEGPWEGSPEAVKDSGRSRFPGKSKKEKGMSAGHSFPLGETFTEWSLHQNGRYGIILVKTSRRVPLGTVCPQS